MRRHFFWIAELFIWLMILSLVSGGIMLAKYTYKKRFNTYQIFLPDVDGLINGSPVRLLGIQVGYVNQIDIVGEDVYVKFIITDPRVKLPKGSSATVEFSGLGGSKSLELYPPSLEDLPSDKIIIAKRPKRIHDSLGLLNDMLDQVSEIAFDVSHFMNEVGFIKGKNKESVMSGESAKAADEFLDFSDNWINKAQKQCEKLNKKLNGKNNKNEVKNDD